MDMTTAGSPESLLIKFQTPLDMFAVNNGVWCGCCVYFGRVNAAFGCSVRTHCDSKIKLRFILEVSSSAAVSQPKA